MGRANCSSSLRTTELCPTLVPSRPNSPRSAAFAQPKKRFGRGPPSSLRKIWPSEWKNLAISGKTSLPPVKPRGQVG